MLNLKNIRQNFLFLKQENTRKYPFLNGNFYSKKYKNFYVKIVFFRIGFLFAFTVFLVTLNSFMKKIYLVPNIITAFGLACGLFVIFKINMIEPGSGHYQVILSSAILLLVAALADFIDGALARVFQAESSFGVMFDSLADTVSFGVAPSVLLLKSLSLEQGSLLSFISASGAMIYSLCGVLRLARFNVLQSKIPKEEKKHFTGLPIPAAAAASVAATLFFLSPVFKDWFFVPNGMRAAILTAVMILLGYLMVCKWKFPSLKVFNFKVPSFHLAFITVVLGILFLYGILHFFAIVLAVVSWSYILLGVVLAMIRKIAGKKSKTLQDFEPDPEDFEDEHIS